MGDLDKDLCLFWKSVASANITFPTASIISFEFLEGQLEMHIDAMLGKGKLAELRAIARSHKLAAGSQTVPNSVVEIAISQGKTPPQGPTPSGALPAPERKKLALKRPKRKTTQVVSEEEDDDEATEDGLITKRKRVTTSTPPALPTPTPPSPPVPLETVKATPLAAAPIVIESGSPNYAEDPPSASTPFVSVGEGPPSTTSIAGAILGEDEGAQVSPTPIAEVPASPPRLEAPLAAQTQEGGGESQHQTPPAPPASASSLLDPFKETLGPFAAQLKIMAEDLPSLVSRAVKDSLKKLQEENSELKESNLMIKAELRNTRKEASDLRQKLHLQLQEKIDLESKLVPLRVKVADLEAARKAEASKVERIEKRSTDREILLGKVEADRDKALAELSQAREEATKVAAELAQARGESKKAIEELARAHEDKEGLKNQIHELEQSAAQILTSGFEAALEQMSCQYPELDLSMLSICNEVVDGKIVPFED
ncbi:uncharacterized protein [Phaseolus vulgaris]|uniref:uncharacterized protein n=1 Tax=Phaseolus vulgaris TaxID=3885 RepID=UPI0035CAA03E